MPEEFGFEQGFGDTRAVERHEPFVVSSGLIVDEPGEHILTDAAFARDQDFDLAGGNACRHAKQMLEGRARPYNARSERIAVRAVVGGARHRVEG